ncbi:MAG: 16S rRNA (guanine(527)-N(7))-methyltransferase RsmG [Vicingaceae bacterium]
MDILLHYFPELNEIQKKQFADLEGLYKDWNQKINVISRKDMDAFYERHVLHALGIAKLQDFKSSTKILDVGTGGGFPGIPLAIYFPEVQFTLVDSIGKKIKVVKAVAESLGLKNVKAYHQRAEKVEGKFDFVVSRAVTRADKFVPWVDAKIKKKGFNDKANGYFFLKGGELSDEFAPLRKYFEVHALSACYKEEFFDTKKVVYLKS